MYFNIWNLGGTTLLGQVFNSGKRKEFDGENFTLLAFFAFDICNESTARKEKGDLSTGKERKGKESNFPFGYLRKSDPQRNTDTGLRSPKMNIARSLSMSLCKGRDQEIEC